MNGPALIGVMVAAAMLAFIYIASDENSVWPRVGFVLAGSTGVLALDVPWLTTILIFAIAGVGLFGLRALNRFAIGSLHWDAEAARRQRGQGLGDDWQGRYGGDASGDNWRDARSNEGEAGYRGDDHEGERAGRNPSRTRSTERSKALRLLGLDERATDSDVRRAHRRLMKKHHPDRGGSTDMATRLNRARELLLG